MINSTLYGSVIYFLSTFGIGFALGTVRVLLLVPQIGERYAELMEMPLMMLASFRMARMVVSRMQSVSKLRAFVLGTIALSFLLMAELGVVFYVRFQTIPEYLESRDPVSFAGYLCGLAVFWFSPLYVASEIRQLSGRSRAKNA